METRLGGGKATCIASLVLAMWHFTGIEGCGGGVFVSTPDSGGDDGATSPMSDAASACAPADCVGLGAPLDAKLCPGGTSVGRTVCAKQADGRCGWDFAPCPTVDAAGPCQCAGPAPGVASVRCSDGSISGPVCATHADGTCSWQIRSCPTPVCPALGCDPACPNGILKDSNGCDTCMCAPAPEGGGGTSCRTSADCSTGNVCGFRESDGCSAVGSCFPAPGIICNAFSPGCACDGTIVNIACNGLPTGYEPKALRHVGVCTDGGSADAATD